MSVNENKWLVMHMHVQLKLDELCKCSLQMFFPSKTTPF